MWISLHAVSVSRRSLKEIERVLLREAESGVLALGAMAHARYYSFKPGLQYVCTTTSSRYLYLATRLLVVA